MKHDFEWAKRNDPIVHHGIQRGASLEQIISALCERHESFTQKLLALDAIRPRKIIANGQALVWHCPDEFVPAEFGH